MTTPTQTNGQPKMETRFAILGPLLAQVGDRPVAVTADRDRTLLAALVLNPGRPVTLARLVDAVWGHRPPRDARNQVQGCVSRLRRRFTAAGASDGLIATEPAGYRLNVAPANLDVNRFRQLRTAAQHASTAEPAATARAYRAALSCWRGPALADVDSVVIRRAATALDEERLQTVEAYFAAELAAGLASGLVPPLTELIHEHPYRERLHAILMLALYRSGRHAEAIAAYQRVRQHLLAELGTEPGVALQRVHRAIQDGAPALLLRAGAGR